MITADFSYNNENNPMREVGVLLRLQSLNDRLDKLNTVMERFHPAVPTDAGAKSCIENIGLIQQVDSAIAGAESKIAKLEGSVANVLNWLEP